ncbi:MAG: mechanosensitive ion channel [Jaaginema sp. PMC 1079.18]|nr:mechanosensitive ion channel [Jaaginema sp. PMC 1080.18]MEC4851995.1 mechanosensitive ion channel [Jaaginema sp. PMC 1079.18]
MQCKDWRKFLVLAISFCLCICLTNWATAQELEGNEIDGYSVRLGTEEIFTIQKGIGEFSAKDRVEAVNARLAKIAEDESILIDSFRIEDRALTTIIKAEDELIVTITNRDARAAERERLELAEDYLEQLQSALKKYRLNNNIKRTLGGIFWALLATIVLIILFNVINYALPRVYGKVDRWRNDYIPALRRHENGNFIQLLNSYILAIIGTVIVSLIQIISLILIVGLPCLYVTLVLSFFTSTEAITQAILDYIETGNPFRIALVLLVTYYSLIVLRLTFTELGRGTVKVSWFHQEWAEPTYRLIAFFLISTAIVAIFPYIPGYQSLAFQGFTVFLGIVVSLSSTVAIANVVSGIILIYTRAFKTDDYVKIADATGEIVEETLLVTRIRTSKNVVITIPNTMVLGSQIINYSAAVRDRGIPLVLHANITLGYDVPWRKVNEVLLKATQTVELISQEPAPYVLQKSLDDFYVSYELNAYTNHPNKMHDIYSELYQSIQDCCNENDIEILSPHYSAIRDGNQITIPESYLPDDYEVPSFRIQPLGGLLTMMGQNSTTDGKNGSNNNH